MTKLRVKRSRLIVAFLAAPAAGPLLFVLLQVYRFGIPKGPVPFLESVVVVWAVYAWPAYAGAVVFGVPLALAYLRFGLTSWIAYWFGGLLCAATTAICLVVAGNRSRFFVQLNELGLFIILYGLVAGSCVRVVLLGSTAFKPIGRVVGSSSHTPRRPNEVLTKVRGIWILLLLVIVPPIAPLIWLFIEAHPYGVPSGPEQVIVSILAFAISFASPLCVEGLVFGVPLALVYRRFRIGSWLPCAGGGALNALIAFALLGATGQAAEVLGKPAAVVALFAGHGALSAIILHTFLLASVPSESNRCSKAEL